MDLILTKNKKTHNSLSFGGIYLIAIACVGSSAYLAFLCIETKKHDLFIIESVSLEGSESSVTFKGLQEPLHILYRNILHFQANTSVYFVFSCCVVIDFSFLANYSPTSSSVRKNNKLIFQNSARKKQTCCNQRLHSSQFPLPVLLFSSSSLSLLSSD